MEEEFELTKLWRFGAEEGKRPDVQFRRGALLINNRILPSQTEPHNPRHLDHRRFPLPPGKTVRLVTSDVRPRKPLAVGINHRDPPVVLLPPFVFTQFGVFVNFHFVDSVKRSLAYCHLTAKVRLGGT